VPTTGEANSRGNEVLLESKAKAVFQALIDNTALPGTTPASTAPTDQASGGTTGGGAQPEQ
jgi:hypothetical protein